MYTLGTGLHRKRFVFFSEHLPESSVPEVTVENEIPTPEVGEKKEFIPQKIDKPYGKEEYIDTKELLGKTESDVATKMYTRMLDKLQSIRLPEEQALELAGEYMRTYGMQHRQMVESHASKEEIRSQRKIWQQEFYEKHKEVFATVGITSYEDFRVGSVKKKIPEESSGEDSPLQEEQVSSFVTEDDGDDGLDALDSVQSEYLVTQEMWQERVIRENSLSDEERGRLSFVESPGEEVIPWEEFIADKSLGSPDDIVSIPRGQSMTFGFADENGISEVSCVHIPSGDYILRFPSGESLVIDANGDEEKAREEILFIQDIASTPIARRLLSSGMGKFNEFRRTLERKYSNIPAVRTSEGFIDLALSEICRMVKENTDTPLLSDEKRVMENIQTSINTRGNLSETQRFLRNNRDVLVSLLARQGILYNEGSRGINIFHMISRM